MDGKPVLIELTRRGGALCRLTVAAWPEGPAPTVPTGVEVLEDFEKPLEQVALTLPPGAYRVVCMMDVIEAINGTYEYRYSVGGKERGAQKGDVNVSSKPHDIRSFRTEFGLEVSP